MIKIETLSQAQTYLESLLPDLAGAADYKKPGLERMRALLNLLGNPQDKYPTIHIGGTAGKGSSATIIANTLSTAGYKTGLHISPHLEDIRERMQINRGMPSEKEFIRMVNEIRPFVEKAKTESEYGSPSYFEVLLALAFLYFVEQKVDIAVIEVGIGGTLDGTNVITPICSVLTNVELDHTEILGNTVEEIAQDKTGIFKKGVPVVSGVTQPSVRKIAEEKASEIGSPIQLIGRESYTIHTQDKKGSIFDIALPYFQLKDVHLSLLGKHQVQNAVVSLAVFEKIKAHGFAVDEQSIRKSFDTIAIPGRAEIVQENPTVILDGAHNPAKMRAFVETVKTIFPDRQCKIVFAVKKGKNVAEMLSILDQITQKYYLTTFQSTTDFGKNQAMDPNDIKNLTRKPSEIFTDSKSAYEKALGDANESNLICVTGSLFLVGELRKQIT